MKRKSIVLSGYYGFDNMGDEAVLLSIIQQLKANDFEPVILSNNPEKTKRLYQVNSVHRMKLKEVISVIRSSDGLISGGGSLLQDITSAASSFYYLGIIKIAQFFKKPVFVYSQGMGPFFRNYVKWSIKNVLNSCTYLSVRDQQSKELLESIGVKTFIDVSCDPVLGIQKEFIVSLDHQLRTFLDKNPVVISLRNWENQRLIVDETRELVEKLVEKNIPVLFLPFHFPNDVEISTSVLNGLSETNNVMVWSEPLTVSESIEVISNAKLVIGMRLHSLIFAASQSIPFIGISYDPKVDAFCHLFEQNTITDTVHFSSEKILCETERILANLDKEILRIQNLNQTLIDRIKYPIVFISNFFKGRD